ncbi:MAG TPA: hypothetical protein VKY22_15575 [Bradyrhizobium sp.]|nr:hypothetical protein [Bradyrhizobium sp.]
MGDREKEQIKLRANALDRASTACLTVGVLAPFAASLYTGNNAEGWKLFLATILYLGAALVLHRLASSVLEGLE